MNARRLEFGGGRRRGVACAPRGGLARRDLAEDATPNAVADDEWAERRSGEVGVLVVVAAPAEANKEVRRGDSSWLWSAPSTPHDPVDLRLAAIEQCCPGSGIAAAHHLEQIRPLAGLDGTLRP